MSIKTAPYLHQHSAKWVLNMVLFVKHASTEIHTYLVRSNKVKNLGSSVDLIFMFIPLYTPLSCELLASRVNYGPTTFHT